MKQDRRRTVGRVLGVLAPSLVAVAGPALAILMPTDAVWGNVVSAVLWSLPPWMMGLQVPWAFVAGLLTGQRLLGLLALVLGLLGMGRPVELPALPPADAVSVVVANVNAYAPEEHAVSTVEAELAGLGAEVVVVLEQRPLQLPGYLRVADNFHDELPRTSHGSAIFCRRGTTCAARITPEFGSQTARMPLAIVRLPGDICLLGLHAPPPVPYDPTGLMPHIRWVADHIEGGRLIEGLAPCEVGDPVVVAGDLNQVPGSRPYQLFVNSGLTDEVASHGVFAASWPAGGGWPDLPFFRLDQLLAGELAVGGVVVRRFDGADHKGMSFWVGPRSGGASEP